MKYNQSIYHIPTTTKMNHITLSQTVKESPESIEPMASYIYRQIVKNNVAKGYNERWAINELEKNITMLTSERYGVKTRNEAILDFSLELDVGQLGEHNDVMTEYGFECDEKLVDLMNALYRFCEVYEIRYDYLTHMSCQHTLNGFSSVQFYPNGFVNILEFLRKHDHLGNKKFDVFYNEFFHSGNIESYYMDELDYDYVFKGVVWTIQQSKIQYFTDEFNKLISDKTTAYC